MIHEGCVVLFRFPNTDHTAGKLRPALVVRELPGRHDDWLICMISSRMTMLVSGIDEIINESDNDFIPSGLKTPSVIRACRLAVVNAGVLSGIIGSVGEERLSRIRSKLAHWIAAGSL